MSLTGSQYAKLMEIQQKLFDVLIDEADPANWPGHGLSLAAMDRTTRGDKYWAKRNAAATMSLIARAQAIFKAEIDNARRNFGIDDDDPVSDPDPVGATVDIETEVERFEQAAQRVIDRAMRSGGSAA